MKRRWISLCVAAATLGGVTLSHAAEVRERGFSVSIGSVGSHLDLEDGPAAALAEDGIDFGSTGTGAEILLGYRFTPHLSLGLRASGSELETGKPGVDGGLGMFALEIKGHLRPGSAIQPYLIGSTGGAALVFDEDRDSDDDALEASLFGVGAGVDVHFARRWNLSFDYRTSVLAFHDAKLERDNAPDLELDGGALAHTLGFRWSFLF